MWSGFDRRRQFSELNEQEVLSLAISSEEDDARIYQTYSVHVQEDYPATAEMLLRMAKEENRHRERLISLHQRRFGNIIPLIRREHIAGYYNRKPLWLVQNLGIARIRAEVAAMEEAAHQFYILAAQRTSDADTRRLLGDLAAMEARHTDLVASLEKEMLPEDVRSEEDALAHRQFILTWVQPGLAGLMDGSVSTLAPVFATAFATQSTWTTFLVGLAASIGAGISMGFTEAAADDGTISGRGSPIKRGLAAGVMTALGGLGHALPYLITNFWMATSIAFVMVFCELWSIAWIQKRYMETPFWRAALQVVLGGALVFAAGVLIGNA
ncbi:iron exporter MbfA [Brenneria uluponensis]|uniref:iron exporter MbfA n=1 Tax=Brenneria uluponensis TaxID=3057057 RepID=UPI0028EC10AC|nr:ferritin family protein [Brenneria ulupoensis]